jgi:hypothetical protein
MMEMVAVLAVLPRHFLFSTVEGVRPEPVHRITLRPKGGMPLKLACGAARSHAGRRGLENRSACPRRRCEERSDAANQSRR